MPINWKEKATYQRLLAAIVAAHPDLRLNYNQIAAHFGQGATYDSIEGRFRAIRRDAEKLKEDHAANPSPQTPYRGRGASTNSTPRKARNTSTSNTTTPTKQGVLNGRIGKAPSNATSPSKTKRHPASTVKVEQGLATPSFSAESASGSVSAGTPMSVSAQGESFEAQLQSVEALEDLEIDTWASSDPAGYGDAADYSIFDQPEEFYGGLDVEETLSFNAV